MSQSLIVASSDPLAKIVPILLKATEMTALSCPNRLAISVFVLMSQSLIIVFDDPLAKIVPVLLKAIEVTLPLYSCKLEAYVVSTSFSNLIVSTLL